MEEKDATPTPQNGDWADEYKGERPKTDSKFFSDAVPKGEISFKGKFKFLDEGKKVLNKWNNASIVFTILYEGKEKILELSGTSFDVLSTLAKNKPLKGKEVEWERTGEGQLHTRRKVKF